MQSYNLILTISVIQKNIFNFSLFFSLPFSKVQANCSLENRHLHTPHLQSQARLSYAEAQPNFTKKRKKIKNFATCKVAKFPNILIILPLLKLRIFNKQRHHTNNQQFNPTLQLCKLQSPYFFPKIIDCLFLKIVDSFLIIFLNK